MDTSLEKMNDQKKKGRKDQKTKRKQHKGNKYTKNQRINMNFQKRKPDKQTNKNENNCHRNTNKNTQKYHSNSISLISMTSRVEKHTTQYSTYQLKGEGGGKKRNHAWKIQ